MKNHTKLCILNLNLISFEIKVMTVCNVCIAEFIGGRKAAQCNPHTNFTSNT